MHECTIWTPEPPECRFLVILEEKLHLKPAMIRMVGSQKFHFALECHSESVEELGSGSIERSSLRFPPFGFADCSVFISQTNLNPTLEADSSTVSDTSFWREQMSWVGQTHHQHSFSRAPACMHVVALSIQQNSQLQSFAQTCCKFGHW